MYSIFLLYLNVYFLNEISDFSLQHMGCGLTFEHNGHALDETLIKTDGVL